MTFMNVGQSKHALTSLWLVLLGAVTVLAGASAAQAASAPVLRKEPPPVQADPQGLVRVALTTALGTIVIGISPGTAQAPISCAMLIRSGSMARFSTAR